MDRRRLYRGDHSLIKSSARILEFVIVRGPISVW
jgi:hypothetical protein